jgi:multicomponent Na+:H+ antiporter subunit G
MLLGLSLQAGFTQTTIKLALILIFLVYTAPAATHALAKAALVSGLKPRLGAAPRPAPEERKSPEKPSS